MRLRTLDADGMQAYLNELRPRLFTLRIRADKVNLRWWVPTWAIEEPLRFFLRLLPIVRAAAPATTRRMLERLRLPHAGTTTDDERPELWNAIDELFSEADRDLLALPGDVPFVDLETNDVRVFIGQTRL